MAISYIGGNSTYQNATSDDIAPTIHASHTTDDFMIALVMSSENIGARTWDDDGGGSNGWTLHEQNRSTSGRDMETAIYWKFATSGSETNPTFTIGGGSNEPTVGAILVYRGVDKIDPFKEVYSFQVSTPNPTNPAIDTDFDNDWVLLWQSATHDDITVTGGVTGYTARESVNVAPLDHMYLFTVDKSVATAGTVTPAAWAHTTTATTPESQVYTIDIHEAQPMHITGGTAYDAFLWGATGKTITGDGFEATQSTGKVEFWSDLAGTVKSTQTIDSWSDTSITIDTEQGSLDTNGIIYLVVTNASGDVSAKTAVTVGILNYEDLITSTEPDHFWTLDDTYNDSGRNGNERPMTVAIVGTHTFETTPLYEGATKAWYLNNVTDKREIADSDHMNVTINSKERTLMASVQLGGIQKSLATIWKEGGGVQNLAFLMGMGNTLVWQLADTASTRDNVQAYSDFKLAPDRTYHITGYYSHNDTTKESRLFIDGVIQTVTDGNPMTLGIFDSHSGDVVWGKSDNNLEMGTADITFTGQEDCLINGFATWSDDSTGTDAGRLSDANIKLLARRSFIPHITIDEDTEVNMQTDIDTYADTERPDKQLCIRVEALSGGGDLELDFDNITFNPSASVQVQYRGADTLTVVKQNGTLFDTDKFDTPAGGTITVVEDVPVKITALDIVTGLAVESARVLVEADTGGDLTAGVDILGDVTDVNGVAEDVLRYTSDQPVVGRVRKASTAPYYQTGGISATITSDGLDLEIFLIKDQ